MAVNAFGIILIVFSTSAPIFSIIAAIAFMWYYSSPEDYKRAWIPRGVVVIAFSLAFMSVFLLPIDVANARLDGGLTFALGVIWQVFYGIVCVFVIVIIPFTIFYYEAEDPEYGIAHQFKWASICTVISTIVVIVICGALYYPIGLAEIPYQRIASANYNEDIDAADNAGNGAQYSNVVLQSWVSPVLYVLALTNCIGYLILIVCGGWGLTALPVQLIKNFIFKPRRVHADEFARQKIAIQNKSERLIEIGRQLQEAQDSGRLKRSQVRVLKDFKEATYRLENDWNILHKSFYQAGGSVILPYISLILGILSGCVSIVWIIHIILYMSVPGYPTDVTFGPISPCLNTVFIGLDRLTSEFPAIGAIFYVGFTFYLLLCVLAGATLMSRVVPFFSVHPMKKNDTMMNSILFNVGLFLIASATVNQFCTQAFSGYARATALDSLFQTSVASLQYIKWYFFSTTYVLLLFAGIGFVMTFVCWRERTKDEKELADVMERLNLK